MKSEIERDGYANKTVIREKYDEGAYTLPRYDHDLDVIKKLQFLSADNIHLAISPYGEDYYKLIGKEPDGTPNLYPTPAQKKYLNQNLINYEDKEKLKNLFLKFSNHHNEWRVANDRMLLKDFAQELALLQESNFLEQRIDNMNYVVPDCVAIFDIIKREDPIDARKKSQEKKDAIGLEAERLTLEYEKERLRKLGRDDLARLVNNLPSKEPKNGYDIDSFEGRDSVCGDNDRKIESKGTRTSKPYFYWTDNEVKTAFRERDNYLIYVWINVLSTYYEPKLRWIKQNPYKAIMIDGEQDPTVSNWKVDVNKP